MKSASSPRMPRTCIRSAGSFAREMTTSITYRSVEARSVRWTAWTSVAFGAFAPVAASATEVTAKVETMPSASTRRIACTTAQTVERLLGNEPDGPERGQRHERGKRLVVPADGLRLDGAEVADAGAAVVRRVGVEQLLPAAAHRHPDAVVIARDG